MNSGNSGSLQSSSGGDEEYDSRVQQDSFSAFFNPTNQPPPNSSNYLVGSPNLDNTTTTTTAWLWNNIRRSEPICTEMINPFLVSTSSSSFVSSSPTVPFPGASSSLLSSSTTVALHNPPKKKRNRASRRAPTTVMTTDATNFRAMVQEFTGIPTSTNFPAPTTTLDLYPTASTIRSNPSSQYSSFSSSSSQLLPSYLLRPFPQRLQQPQTQPPQPPSDQLGLLDMLQSHPPQGSYGLKMGDQYFGN